MINKNIHVVDVQHNLGQSRRGVDMRPSTIRFAGLNSQLNELRYNLIDQGNITCCTFETGKMGDPKIRFLDEIVNYASELKKKLKRSYKMVIFL